MYWSGYDTLLLVTGILTALLVLLPVKSFSPSGRFAAAGIGILLIIVSVILGNLPSFTYPSFVFIGPLFPIGAAVLLVSQHMRTAAAQQREKSDPFIPTSLPVQAAGPAPVASNPTMLAQVSEVTTMRAPTPAATMDPDLAAAMDPATPLETLADVAFRVPEARAAVAANPSTYPDLLQWLAQFDEPAIRQALEGRRSSS